MKFTGMFKSCKCPTSNRRQREGREIMSVAERGSAVLKRAFMPVLLIKRQFHCGAVWAVLSLCVFLLHERDHGRSHTGRSKLSSHTRTQTRPYTRARGLKEQVNISCDVSPLNVSSGGCKYSISLPVIGQKWEIIMKHERGIILYSCDNISLFHKRAQIFIRIEKPFDIISGTVKWNKKDFTKGRKRENAWRESF